MLACQKGRVEVVGKLLQRGAKVDLITKVCRTVKVNVV